MYMCLTCTCNVHCYVLFMFITNVLINASIIVLINALIIEMKYSISVLSRWRTKWGPNHFRILLKSLEYGHATRKCGLKLYAINSAPVKLQYSCWSYPPLLAHSPAESFHSFELQASSPSVLRRCIISDFSNQLYQLLKGEVRISVVRGEVCVDGDSLLCLEISCFRIPMLEHNIPSQVVVHFKNDKNYHNHS
jgi:hypothetical protein